MAIIDKIQLSGTVYTIGNETTTAVTSASTDNEIPTAKAVYDAIPQGGGGKAVSAGTNISITTGETADTINCTLNLANGSGTNSIKMKNTHSSKGSYSFAIGSDGVKASGMSSFAGGSYSEAKGIFSMAFGRYSTTNNYGEVALGFFGKSNGSSNEPSYSSGNTLFSIGNGGNGYGMEHNAFEIRQNGDIYITKDGQDVKLQDQLGGGSITIDTSLDSGSTNAVANSAITTAINTVSGAIPSTYVKTISIDTDQGWRRFVRFSTPNNYNYFILDNPKINGTPIHIFDAIPPNIHNFSLVETSAITTSVTSSSTDSQVPSAKAVNDKLGGLSLVKLTQSEYDALSPNYDANTLYVING